MGQLPKFNTENEDLDVFKNPKQREILKAYNFLNNIQFIHLDK